jgi:site-specific recombinase XerD
MLASPLHWPLRHAFGSWALADGHHLATVADNMRHASRSTTHFYLHADDETAALSDGVMSRLAARNRAERHLQVVQGA